ncbi:MAG: alcohol dehydrogenase catalytic domain-containing protein [Vicinamibacterales bacterium]
MLAAVFAREGVLELQDRPVPDDLAADEVRIAVEGCGICGTDLHILDTPPGHPATPGSIMGHEMIGRIVAAGSGVRTRAIGERVAVAPNITCGACARCTAGRANHCEHFTTLGIFRDGGLAAFCRVPERACYPLADHVPFDDAIWTEVLSCVVGSVSNVRCSPGETVAIIGGGPVGALHAQLFLASGARVIVSDLSDARLDRLAAAGVQLTVNPRRDDLVDVVRRDTAGGADIVVDCVGTALDLALDLTATGGRISLFGMNSTARPAVRQNTITRNELTIFGSYVGVNTFPRAIALLEQATIRPSIFLSGVVPLEEVGEAMRRLRGGDAMKLAVRPSPLA